MYPSYFTDQNQEYGQLVASVGGYEAAMRQAEKTAKAYREAVEEDTEALAQAENRVETAEQAVQGLTGALEGQNTAQAEVNRQSQQLRDILEDTAQQVADLEERYKSAYAEALESVSGQYALWDQAAEVTATSADAINGALESQTEYWRQYNENLASLAERSGQIEGLGDLLASFADGSKDSVNAIAGLASASDADLKKMVENWQALKQEQAAAVDSLAEVKTDLTGTMDDLQAELEQDIQAMDLREQAAASAKATLQGYLDGAGAMMPQVRALYRELTLGAANTAAVTAYRRQYGGNSGEGYASGTDNARPGWALVGEQGPELLFFRGGEKVLNATRTAALQAKPEPVLSALPAASPAAPVQVVFQINGNVPPETVEKLREYGDEFARRVLEVLQDEENDRLRRAY